MYEPCAKCHASCASSDRISAQVSAASSQEEAATSQEAAPLREMEEAPALAEREPAVKPFDSTYEESSIGRSLDSTDQERSLDTLDC